MTSTRYWAASGPRLGPDDFDHQLLEPGTDAELDLAASLLAAHRVGEAACQVAAETPLLTESTLIGCMAAARLELADPLVDSVSKSVEGVNYGALLARDVLDAAERGVLAVFRAAVSKGVAPPLAASRAGAVYGCPTEELGRYRALASDPRAHPLALTDAADRALFTTIHKIASEEFRSEVSKATAVLERKAVAVRPDDPSTPYYDARTVDGRFAAVGTKTGTLEVLRRKLGLKRAEPEVQAEPETAPATTKTRQVRQTRQRRQIRAKPSTSPANVAVGTKQTATQAAKIKLSTLLRAKPTAHQRALLNTNPSGGGGGDDDGVDDFNPLEFDPYIPRDVLAKPLPDDTGTYTTLEDREFGYPMSERHGKQWLAAMERATGSAGTRMIRIGHLMNEYGDPVDSLNNAGYEDVVDNVVRDTEGGDDFLVVPVSLQELQAEGNIHAQRAYLEKRKDEMATDDQGVINWEMRDEIQEPADLASGGILLVHYRKRPPTIYHLSFADPRGLNHGNWREFDPNAPYKAQAKRYDEEQYHQDPVTKDWIKHFVVRFEQTTEDTVASYRKGTNLEKRLVPVSKAVAVLERAELSQRASRQARDQQGRFSDMSQLVGPDAVTLQRLREQIAAFGAPAAAPTRQVRQVRQRRQMRRRAGTANEQQAVARQHARIGIAQQMAGSTVRTALARARATQTSKVVLPGDKNSFSIIPSSVYVSFSPQEWKRLQIAQGSEHSQLDVPELLVRRGGPLGQMLQTEQSMGDETQVRMRDAYVSSQDYLDDGGRAKPVAWNGDDGTPGGRFDLLEKIRDMVSKPEIANVTAIRTAHPTHPGRYQWNLYPNINKPQPIVLIEFDEAAEMTPNTRLELAGKSIYRYEEHLSDSVIDSYAIPMLRYRATAWDPEEASRKPGGGSS